MFEIGTYIVYGSSGICKVVDIGTIQNSIAAPDRLYYTLQPVYATEVIYTPVDSSVFMRPALTRQEAEELIEQIPFIREEVCISRDLSKLREHYETSFRSHNCEDLVMLIKSVYTKNQNAVHNRKKLGQLDQRYMKRAEELLYGELSVALGIPKEEVVSYIEEVARRVELQAQQS